MKFLVFFVTVCLSLVQCVARTGWNSASYNDEVGCSMGWSGYLKRLSLIAFMIAGVVLYYVPSSRFYFCRACHEMIDFVADGLKTALNPTDTGYITDDSSSIYSEPETERNFGKRASCLSNDDFAEDRVTNAYTAPSDNRIIISDERSKPVGNKINCYRQFDRQERNRSFRNLPTNTNILELPFETIQIYPGSAVDAQNFSRSKYYCRSERDSEASVICTVRKNGHHILDPADEDNSGLESEPTQYPDEESMYDRSSDVEHLNSYLCIEEEVDESVTRRKLEEQLLDFDRTFRSLCSSLSQKNSTRSDEKDEYTARLIGTILRSVKSSFGDVTEGDRKRKKKCYRKSKGTSRMPIVVTSEYRDRKWDRKTVESGHRCDLCATSSSVKRNVYRDSHGNIVKTSTSRNRTKNVFFIPEEFPVDIPIITNHVKPMLERAVHWFYSRCPNIETE